MACEMFTKYAGYTQEFLVFDSTLYEPGAGLRMDVLFSLTKNFNFRAKFKDVSPDIKSLYNVGRMVIGEANNPYLFQVFDEKNPDTLELLNSYDYLIGDYRRVIDVYDFEEGSNNGINTLFTIEQTLAQQTYFSYAMGNYGFDLISWVVLKNWLDTREKVLGMMPYLRFDPYTQVLKIIPEPKSSNIYYGLVGCKVQRPIRFLIQELWIYRYTLAQTKIAIGHVRGKYQGTNLFGGQTVNGTDLMRQGEKEKDELEKEIVTDLIDRSPTNFFIG
jgi:hypothetical protein